jgi:hypothetical protein
LLVLGVRRGIINYVHEIREKCAHIRVGRKNLRRTAPV